MTVIIMSIVVLCGIAVLLLLLFSKNTSAVEAGQVRVLPVSGQDLFYQKCMLEQKMAGVAGGKTGLVMLLDMIQNNPNGNTDLYRESYRDKQAKLRGYLEEYDGLLCQARVLPEEERVRFAPSEEIAQYRQLLKETV